MSTSSPTNHPLHGHKPTTETLENSHNYIEASRIRPRRYFTAIKSEEDLTSPLWVSFQPFEKQHSLWRRTLNVIFSNARQKAGRPSRSVPSSHSTMKKAIRNECNLSNVMAWAVRNLCPLWGPYLAIRAAGVVTPQKNAHLYFRVYEGSSPFESRYCVVGGPFENAGRKFALVADAYENRA